MRPFVWALGLIVASATVPVMISAARAADCGGGIPCACGDHVAANHTLVSGVDPVTVTRCPGDGLTVGSGVTLDLGGTRSEARRGQRGPACSCPPARRSAMES